MNDKFRTYFRLISDLDLHLALELGVHNEYKHYLHRNPRKDKKLTVSI